MGTTKKDERIQINLRVDGDFRRKLAELQRLDRSSDRVPSVSEVIRKAVEEALARAKKGK
jgi:Arc/MetJ-type ribon-helix-helix transcriptional regulator